MTGFVEKLKASGPTLGQDKSRDLFESLLRGQRWVMFSSGVLGLDETVTLASEYTTRYSAVDTPTERLLTSSPIQVFCCLEPKYQVWGLLYANGAVAYIESVIDVMENEITKPDPLLFVWIEKELADDLGLAYLDGTTGEVSNLDSSDTLS